MNNVIKQFGSVKKNRIKNRSSFIKRLADLIDEGYTFHDSIKLLLPHHILNFGETSLLVDRSFKNGCGVVEILEQIGFSSAELLPIAIAEIDGQLAKSLQEMADRLDSREEQKKRLKSIMAYPFVLFLFISALLVAFRKFFLPNLEMMAASRQEKTNFIVKILPSAVSRIPDFLFGAALFLLLCTIAFYYVYKKMTPQQKIKWWISLPVGGSFFCMMKTRDFAGEMGSLLQSGLSLQNALHVLIEQQLDPVLSAISSNVKEQVIYGEPFHQAVYLTDGLHRHLSAFVKHGSDSGHLPKELLIYSRHLSEQLNRQVATVLSVLQPALFCLIAACILAAYLALLLPVYGMLDHL